MVAKITGLWYLHRYRGNTFLHIMIRNMIRHTHTHTHTHIYIYIYYHMIRFWSHHPPLLQTCNLSRSRATTLLSQEVTSLTYAFSAAWISCKFINQTFQSSQLQNTLQIIDSSSRSRTVVLFSSFDKGKKACLSGKENFLSFCFGVLCLNYCRGNGKQGCHGDLAVEAKT